MLLNRCFLKNNEDQTREFGEDLIWTIKELQSLTIIPIPEGLNIIFCNVCLGANVPGQYKYEDGERKPDYPKGGWCCGSYCDGLPYMGICIKFKPNKAVVEKIKQKFIKLSKEE